MRTIRKLSTWLIHSPLLLVLLAGDARAADEQAAAPQSYVLGISPFLERSVKDGLYRRVIAFVVEDMPMGSALRIYDAYDLQTIAQIQIPNLQPFKSAKTRANQFAEPIRSLKQFLAADRTPPFGRNSVTGLIRLPQFLDFLRQTETHAEPGSSVILVGSPLYLDQKEPSFSMTDGYFPSDGHLRVGRDRSVYGVADRTNSPVQIQVHYAYFGDPWMNDLHQEKVVRFWQLFLQAQGAALVTCSGDLATVFKNARIPAAQQRPLLASIEPDPTQTKVEMLRLSRNVATEDWITRDTVVSSRQPPQK
jgi:hypothetical protein